MLRTFNATKTEIKEIMHDFNNSNYFEWFIMNDSIYVMSSTRTVAFAYSSMLRDFLITIKPQCSTLEPLVGVFKYINAGIRNDFTFDNNSLNKKGNVLSLVYMGESFKFSAAKLPKRFKTHDYFYRLTMLPNRVYGLIVYDRDGLFNCFIAGLRG